MATTAVLFSRLRPPSLAARTSSSRTGYLPTVHQWSLAPFPRAAATGAGLIEGEFLPHATRIARSFDSVNADEA